MWLWPERCDFRIRVGVFLLFVDGIDHRPFLFVCFHPVIREEGLVRVLDRKACLILVGKEFADTFWSCRPEDLR